jgi:hypothetical protein
MRLDDAPNPPSTGRPRDWTDGVNDLRKRFPSHRPPMDEERLIAHLRAGDIHINDNYAIMLVKQRASVVLLEVPWKIASEFAMADIMIHAAHLLSFIRSHTPHRVRINIDERQTSFTLSAID